MIKGHLRRGIGAGKVLAAIAQQLQDNGHPLSQRDLIGGAEGTVGVAGNETGSNACLYKTGCPVGVGYVGVGGGGGFPHLVPVGRGLYCHGDKFSPGDRAVQLHVALVIANHNTQRVDDLGHLLLGRNGGGAGAGRQDQKPEKQGDGSAGGEDGFQLHKRSTSFVIRSAARQWD